MRPPIIVIRHTSVAVGPQTCYGASDVALSRGWRAEFLAIEKKLQPLVVDSMRVYSSPLSRCLRLAGHLAGDSATVVVDERLREMDFGTWELSPWADIPREQTRAWFQDITGHTVPGGESFAEVAARASGFLEALESEPPDTGALVVCHGGVIRALLAHVIGCRLEQSLVLNVDYGGITGLRLGPPHRLDFVNR